MRERGRKRERERERKEEKDKSERGYHRQVKENELKGYHILSEKRKC